MSSAKFFLCLLSALAVSSAWGRNILTTDSHDGQAGCNVPADVIFLLDSSSNVNSQDFKKQQDFVTSFVNDMIIGPTKVQVGVVTFSTDVKSEFDLNTFDNKKDILAAVSKLAQSGGGAQTSLALRHLRTESFTTDHGARIGVPKIVIILTAGPSDNKVKTLAEAKLLQTNPLRIYPIGIGSSVDNDELNAIASKPENILKAANFDALQKIEKTLQEKVCKKAGCSDPADVIFLLDSSSNVNSQDFKKQQDFVTSVVNHMIIGPTKVQVGVVTFSTDVKSEFDLNTFDNKKDILAAVSKLAQSGGGAQTSLALRHLRTESFTTDHGARIGVPKIVIILTAGPSDNKVKTLAEAKLLQTNPLRIYPIGIGSSVDNDELNAIASKPENILKAANFDALQKIEKTLQEKVCKKVCGIKPSDIIFLIDESTSIWNPAFQKQIDFFVSFVKDTVIGRNQTQIGAVTFSTKAFNRFYLNENPSRSSVVNALLAIKRNYGDTYTANALKKVRTESFQVSHGARPDAPHILIIITDGQSTQPGETKWEALKLKPAGITTFAIGVGTQVDLTELATIAGDKSRVFDVPSFDTLHTIEKKLFADVCKTEHGSN